MKQQASICASGAWRAAALLNDRFKGEQQGSEN